MTGSVLAVALAMGLFVGSHLALSSPPLRAPLVSRMGEKGFRGIYSLLSLVLLVWAAFAYRDAPVVDLWDPPIGLKHLSLLIMPIACVLLVAGLTTPNPSAVGGDQPEIINAGPPA
jgi:uncharacterized membrane protein